MTNDALTLHGTVWLDGGKPVEILERDGLFLVPGGDPLPGGDILHEFTDLNAALDFAELVSKCG